MLIRIDKIAADYSSEGMSINPPQERDVGQVTGAEVVTVNSPSAPQAGSATYEQADADSKEDPKDARGPYNPEVMFITSSFL